MACDPGLAQTLRDALGPEPADEKPMMGGLCFMWRGHMLCGVHKGGAMFRVGAPNMTEALAIPGARPMTFTGKPMSGFVDVSDDVCADSRLDRLMAMSRAFVATLPPR